MAEKFDQFSTSDMKALASSPAGRQLMALLRQSGGADLQTAMGKAAAGDMAGAKEILSPLLADPKIQALLSKLGGQCWRAWKKSWGLSWAIPR